MYAPASLPLDGTKGWIITWNFMPNIGSSRCGSSRMGMAAMVATTTLKFSKDRSTGSQVNFELCCVTISSSSLLRIKGILSGAP
mmetsp:Transcript_48330/g.58501  ORF Transcript_48330/g.58501 Transcript_48330/m.58501 type:complete len:84 (+) Transcript_48330:1323-1574(+)